MPPRAGLDVRIIVSGGFNAAGRSGVFLDERIQWVKVPDQLNGKRIKLYGYTLSNLFIRPSLSEMFGLTVLEAASRAPVRSGPLSVGGFAWLIYERQKNARGPRKASAHFGLNFSPDAEDEDRPAVFGGLPPPAGSRSRPWRKNKTDNPLKIFPGLLTMTQRYGLSYRRTVRLRRTAGHF